MTCVVFTMALLSLHVKIANDAPELLGSNKQVVCLQKYGDCIKILTCRVHNR